MRTMLLLTAGLCGTSAIGQAFDGRFYSGSGDVAWLELLDRARRAWSCDDELQSIPMLYTPVWDGLVEGPTWGAWWIQNSYGPTLCALPFVDDATLRWIQNSQDLWFANMGDGERADAHGHVAPDGQLCDAAAPGWVVFRQGDGRWDMHDWGVEFTAAGVVMQAELLLVTRDAEAIAHYLPLLERCLDFLDSRRDPNTGLMLAGPAGNLLAPSYAGFKQPDGSYGMAYLSGLSVTTIGALDRVIELEQLAGRADRAAELAARREALRAGLPRLMTPDGYLIKSLDPDGARHGVYGAERFGYFEAVCNHDAVALRVVDDAAAERIFAFMDGIPGLRPHDLVITQYPSLDDMYEAPAGLWGFGTWVNGGHWSTCEARQILGYFRTGRFDRARASMEAYLKFARQYRLDNPLVEFGAAPYQPNQPINTVYDSFGIPAAMVRGLFEYVYSADSLTLIPHLPPGVDELVQRFPIRFGNKQIRIETAGTGPLTAVLVNGRPHAAFDAGSVRLDHATLPDEAQVVLCFGGAAPPGPRRPPLVMTADLPDPPDLADAAARLREFAGGATGPAADQARLALDWIAACARHDQLAWRHLPEPLPEASREAAEALFRDTAARLIAGLD